MSVSLCVHDVDKATFDALPFVVERGEFWEWKRYRGVDVEITFFPTHAKDASPANICFVVESPTVPPVVGEAL